MAIVTLKSIYLVSMDSRHQDFQKVRIFYNDYPFWIIAKRAASIKIINPVKAASNFASIRRI